MVVCVYQTPLTHPLPTPITPTSLFQTTPSAGAGHQDTLGAFLRKSAGTKQASSQIKSDIRRLTKLSRCFQFDWTSSSQVHVVAAGMHGDLHCCCVCVCVCAVKTRVFQPAIETGVEKVDVRLLAS